MSDEAPKPRKAKNFARINGSCRLGKLTDGLTPKACPACGVVHKRRECPFCRHRRGRK